MRRRALRAVAPARAGVLGVALELAYLQRVAVDVGQQPARRLAVEARRRHEHRAALHAPRPRARVELHPVVPALASAGTRPDGRGWGPGRTSRRAPASPAGGAQALARAGGDRLMPAAPPARPARRRARGPAARATRTARPPRPATAPRAPTATRAAPDPEPARVAPARQLVHGQPRRVRWRAPMLASPPTITRCASAAAPSTHSSSVVGDPSAAAIGSNAAAPASAACTSRCGGSSGSLPEVARLGLREQVAGVDGGHRRQRQRRRPRASAAARQARPAKPRRAPPARPSSQRSRARRARANCATAGA